MRNAPRTSRRRSAVALLIAAAACTPLPAPTPPAEAGRATPHPSRVERLIFLVGDPGEAIPGRSPVLAELGDEIESWATELDPGAITVAYLGDLVYPEGIRPTSDPGHAADTLRLHAQLRPLLGPAATGRGAEAWFVPGNHDWGNRADADGATRLAATERRVEDWAEAGHAVRMLPERGRIGPVVVPLTEGWQAVVIDTQAWLGADATARADAVSALRSAFGAVGVRSILLAHHPLRTGGNHGVRALTDPLALPSRAGAIVQDLPSVAYSRMKAEIEAAIAGSRAPVLAAAGHDHNLQLFRAPAGTAEPEWTLVSGSGSKLTPVSDAPDMVFGGPWPGLARLFLLRDGSAVLQVAATSADAQHCPQLDADAVRTCLREGTSGFRTIWSDRIAGPTDEPGRSPTP